MIEAKAEITDMKPEDIEKIREKHGRGIPKRTEKTERKA